MDHPGAYSGGERLWPDPETGPFRLRIWFGVVDSRPGIVGVEMWGLQPPDPAPAWRQRDVPDAPVQAADIRLPLGAILDAEMAHRSALARAAISREFLAQVAATWPDEALGRAEAAFAASRKAAADDLNSHRRQRPAGASSLPDSLLRTVAAQYQQAVLEGSRAPAQAVAIYFEDLGRDVNEATVRGWIAKARRRGYLAPSRKRAQRARRETEAKAG